MGAALRGPCKMLEGGNPYSYANVERWAAKAKATGGSVFKPRCMTILCNISSSH